jgi:hypothetical protein
VTMLVQARRFVWLPEFFRWRETERALRSLLVQMKAKSQVIFG